MEVLEGWLKYVVYGCLFGCFVSILLVTLLLVVDQLKNYFSEKRKAKEIDKPEIEAESNIIEVEEWYKWEAEENGKFLTLQKYDMNGDVIQIYSFIISKIAAVNALCKNKKIEKVSFSLEGNHWYWIDFYKYASPVENANFFNKVFSLIKRD